jgi:tetratricopeptide (TPR) repeat protein
MRRKDFCTKPHVPQLTRLRGYALAVSIALLGSGCSQKTADAHLKSAADYEAKKEYASAIVEYRAALQLDPTLGEARIKLGDLYARNSDAQNAYREYVRAADTMPDSIDAQLKAGALLLLGNQFADAKARAEKVLRLSPRHPGGLTLLGNALAGLNDMDGAMERLNAAIQADPGQGTLYSNIGVLQLARGDRQMAEASFKRAVNAAPTKVETRVALAHFYRSQGRTGEAEMVLKEALAVDPRSVQVNSNLAQLYIESGRTLEAELPLRTLADERKDPSSLFALADYYTNTDRPKKAAAILDKLAATKESYSLAKARLAAIDYTAGRAAEAHAILNELLKREPNSRIGLVLKGRLLLMEKKPDEALTMAKAAISADPERAADGQFLLAQIYLSTGQIEDALDALRQTLKLDPRQVGAQIALARVYASKGQKLPAIEMAQQAVVTAPLNVDARLALVRAVLASGDAVRAEREIRLLVVRFPNSPAVLTQVGGLYMGRRDFAAARAAFTQALKIDPASSDALAGLVVLDLGANDPRSAIARVEARLSAAPEDATAWYLAARSYALVGDAPQTERALMKTIELDPANLQAYGMMGDLYGMQGKLDQALQQFQAWATREPRSVAAQTMVGLVLEKLNRMPEAQRTYERVLEMDRHAAIAANNLAWMLAEGGGNLDQATELAQAAKSQAPDQPAFNDTLGWIFYKKNLAEQSVPLFQQALEKDPENALTHFHLGMAYAKLGEDSKAIAALKRALALDPQLSTAAEARRTLADLQVS